MMVVKEGHCMEELRNNTTNSSSTTVLADQKPLIQSLVRFLLWMPVTW